MPRWSPTTIEERFWSKVDKNGPTQAHMQTACWLWTGYRNTGGYGQFRISGGGSGLISAHRFAYENHHKVHLGRCSGPGRGQWLVVMHTCDFRGCVNPAHLRLATQTVNNQDMASKGRAARRLGMSHPRAKLTDEEVIRIRDEHAAGFSCVTIGKKYGVTNALVGRIVRKEIWLHV